MLYLNVSRAMEARGIALKKYSHLVKNGFLGSTASKLVRNETYQIRYSVLEQLCITLNCTPNDLFQWIPNERQIVTENTALKALIRGEEEEAIRKMIKDLPLEKFERVKEMLARLNDE